MLCLIMQFFLVIILKRYSLCNLWHSLQNLCMRLIFDKCCYFNGIRQASRASASEEEDHNFFQIVNSNPNLEWEFLLKRNLIISEVRFVAYELFSEFFTHFILNLTFISHYYFKYYYIQIWQKIFIFLFIEYLI